MQNQIVFNRGAVRPIQAFNDAGELLRGHYGGFLGVVIVAVLIMIVGGIIPLTPLMPPMMCGIYLCLFARTRGLPFNTGVLFKGFDYFGQSFVASLFVSIPMFIVSIISVVILQIGMSGITVYIKSLNLDKNPKPSPEEVLPVIFGLLGSFFGIIFLIIAITIIIAFILRMLVVFAYPLIVEYQMPGIDAVKLSIRALFGNFFGVIGLLILEMFFLFAGWMFFYIGIIFVLPFVHAAWFCAYRRVFAPQNIPQLNFPNQAAPQYLWIPQGTSKAGRNLILGGMFMFVIYTLSLSIGGYFFYQSISQAIEKANLERQKKTEQISTTPTPIPNSYGKTSVKSTGILQGQEISLPIPDYPAAAKAVKAGGEVQVKVKIDESGMVMSASGISGHPLLRVAAEQAAQKAIFNPADKKREGILIYNFTPN